MPFVQNDYLLTSVAGVELAVFGVEHQDAPIIFMLHHLGGAAPSVYRWCRDLAADGFVVVALEQRNHGRRVVNAKTHDFDDPEVGPHVFGIVVGTALDIVFLLDFLPAQFGVCTDRVGLSGISLGGTTTLLAMGLDTRIQVGAPMLGSCNFRGLYTFDDPALNVPYGGRPWHENPALDSLTRKYDPIFRPEAFADRPLLLQTGAVDTVVSPALCAGFYQRALPFYTQPDRLVFTNHPDTGHGVSEPMWAATRAWFRRWLG